MIFHSGALKKNGHSCCSWQVLPSVFLLLHTKSQSQCGALTKMSAVFELPWASMNYIIHVNIYKYIFTLCSHKPNSYWSEVNNLSCLNAELHEILRFASRRRPGTGCARWLLWPCSHRAKSTAERNGTEAGACFFSCWDNLGKWDNEWENHRMIVGW